jgi:hypothetical protein
MVNGGRNTEKGNEKVDDAVEEGRREMEAGHGEIYLSK